jgi:hypothetical protein
MNLAETTEILDYLSAIDGRIVTAEKVKAWNDVIGYLDFQTAKESAVMAYRQDNIQFVEPKHIIAFSLKIKEQRKTEENRQRAITEFQEQKPNPMPICHHNKGILYCDPCCRNAAIQAGLIK